MLRGQLCEWWRVVKLLSSLVTEPFAWNLLLLLVCLCWPLVLFTERPGKAPAAPRASGLVSHTPYALTTELSCVLGKAALLDPLPTPLRTLPQSPPRQVQRGKYRGHTLCSLYQGLFCFLTTFCSPHPGKNVVCVCVLKTKSIETITEQ